MKGDGRTRACSCSTLISALLLAVLVLGGPPACAQSRIPGEVSLADGRVFEGAEIRPGPQPADVLVEKGGRRLATVTTRDVVSVEVPRERRREQPLEANLRLTDGDLLQGKLKILDGRKIEIETSWARLAVPLDWIAAVALQPDTPLPAPAARDTAVLGSDRIEGPIQDVTADQVTLQVAGQVVPLKMSQVHALVFAPRPLPPPQGTDPVVQVRFRSGERLTGEWLRMDGDQGARVRLPWGQELSVGFWAASRLEVKDGKLVYLSDMQPVTVKETTLLARPSPFQLDRAVSGLPIRLRGKTFAHGIGVHSRSELTFALDGSFHVFAATLGIDDAVADQGSVVFRVYGDDKLLYESPLVRGNGEPLSIHVPLTQTLSLRLEVDYGDQADIGDHADWADARLLRE